jgi:hypothetical protein
MQAILFHLTMDEQSQRVPVDSPKAKARIRICIGPRFGCQHEKARFIRSPFNYGLVGEHPESTGVIPSDSKNLIRWQPLLSCESGELAAMISRDPARL